MLTVCRIFDELEDYVFDPSLKAAGGSKGKRGGYFDKKHEPEEENSKGEYDHEKKENVT